VASERDARAEAEQLRRLHRGRAVPVDHHYTTPAKLAIYGHSNGGLLIGAVTTQRPDLFGAAIGNAGHYDMLRYQKFTVGAGWVPEFGSSDDPAQFRYLRAYSPLHNVRAGTCYPATLLLTGDHDDRVVPGHAYKFAAALQAAQRCDRPILAAGGDLTRVTATPRRAARSRS
jgi:prolyl oligopeptidase